MKSTNLRNSKSTTIIRPVLLVAIYPDGHAFRAVVAIAFATFAKKRPATDDDCLTRRRGMRCRVISWAHPRSFPRHTKQFTGFRYVLPLIPQCIERQVGDPRMAEGGGSRETGRGLTRDKHLK